MDVRLRLLLALLLIKTNFSAIQTSDDGDSGDIGDDNVEVLNFARKRTKFQEMLASNVTDVSYMDVEETNTTLPSTSLEKDLASAIVRRLSDQFGANVKDMMHAWSWVPQWWRRLRQWTAASTRSAYTERCTRNQQENMISIGGSLLLCAFLPTITGQQLTEPEPVFLAPLENHTVTQGRDIFFTCVVNHLSSYKVAWIKSDTKAILAIHTHMVAQNQRLSVTHNGHNTWKLHVSNVQKNDSGTYMCQINTDPMRSQMGTLEVVIPPDILNDNESTEGGGVALEGGTVRLKCHATGVPGPTVLWRREDSKSLVFRNETTREKQVQRSYDGDTLVLTGIQRSDMGAYLCIASNGVPPSVSKRFSVRVHFHPLIRVSNQLVAAPIASDVLVQCYVEASPRAMNHWTRDTGEKLIPSEKYAMEETPINDYSLLMNLTIKSLDKKDFGGYVCTSSNALGKAEGVVRLQELHLIVKTTSTTPPPRRVDVKPRKPVHKEKPTKKYTRPIKGRKLDGSLPDSTDDDLAEESLRTSLPDTRTLLPFAPTTTTKSPWVELRNSSHGLQNHPLLVLLVVLILALRS